MKMEVLAGLWIVGAFALAFLVYCTFNVAWRAIEAARSWVKCKVSQWRQVK